jgi:hypothetical protein
MPKPPIIAFLNTTSLGDDNEIIDREQVIPHSNVRQNSTRVAPILNPYPKITKTNLCMHVEKRGIASFMKTLISLHIQRLPRGRADLPQIRTLRRTSERAASFVTSRTYKLSLASE